MNKAVKTVYVLGATPKDPKTIYAVGATPIDPLTGKVCGKTQIIYIQSEDVEQHKLFDGKNGAEIAEYVAGCWLVDNSRYNNHEIKFIKMVAENEFIK